MAANCNILEFLHSKLPINNIMCHVSLDKKQSIAACTIGHDILMTWGEKGGKIIVLGSKLKQAACYSDGMNKHEA